LGCILADTKLTGQINGKELMIFDMKPLKFLFAICLISLCTACALPNKDTNKYQPYTRMLIGSSRLPALFWSPLNTYVVDIASGDEIHWNIPQGLGGEVKWSPSGEWIVFSTLWTKGARAGGNAEIYIMKYPEGNVIKVTDYPYDDTDPSWSPSGREITYESNGQIVVLAVDCYMNQVECDAEPLALAKGYSPDWSSNGKWISYQWEGKIYMIPSQGGEPINLTTNSFDCANPNWSPVDMRITFACDDGINVLNVDDNNGPIKIKTGSGYTREPTWSPDGLKIAFISDREDYGLGKPLGSDGMIRSNAVFLGNVDGSDLRRISPYDDEDILWYTWMP